MSKPYNDFHFVIQGPLHKHSLYGIATNYKQYTDNITVSHWNTDKPDLIDYLDKLRLSMDRPVVFRRCAIEPPDEESYKIYNNQNVYYQVLSTHAGVEGTSKVATPYTLKLRSDQWYGNLTPILDAIRAEPEKYTCANLHFRPDHLVKYHPSDKLFGMATELMEKTAKIAFNRLCTDQLMLMAGAYAYTSNRTILPKKRIREIVEPYSYANQQRKLVTEYGEKPLAGTIQIIPGAYIGCVPEVIFGTSFLFAKGILPHPDESIRIVKENFQIVRVEDMLPYVNKDGEDTIEHNSQEIDYIEQYG